MDYITFSQIDMYLRCGEQFRRRYINGEKEPPKITLLDGSAYHDTLYFSNQLRINKDQPLKPSKALEYYMSKLRELTEPDNVDWEGENENKLFKTAKTLIPDYYKNFDDKIVPYQAEESIEKAAVIQGERFKLRGRIDLRTSKKSHPSFRRRTVDYKFSGAVKNKKDADTSLQLSLYAWAKKIPDVGFINFVKSKNPYIAWIPSTRTPAQISWALMVARSVKKALDANVYPLANPESRNWICSERFCGFWSRCRGKYERISQQVNVYDNIRPSMPQM